MSDMQNKLISSTPSEQTPLQNGVCRAIGFLDEKTVLCAAWLTTEDVEKFIKDKYLILELHRGGPMAVEIHLDCSSVTKQDAKRLMDAMPEYNDCKNYVDQPVLP